jgi:hypothetical protein
MDTLGLYAVLSVAAIVIAVGLRFIVYTLLVKNGGWLPEKATKVANTTSVVVVVVSLMAICGNAVMSNHSVH